MARVDLSAEALDAAPEAREADVRPAGVDAAAAARGVRIDAHRERRRPAGARGGQPADARQLAGVRPGRLPRRRSVGLRRAGRRLGGAGRPQRAGFRAAGVGEPGGEPGGRQPSRGTGSPRWSAAAGWWPARWTRPSRWPESAARRSPPSWDPLRTVWVTERGPRGRSSRRCGDGRVPGRCSPRSSPTGGSHRCGWPGRHPRGGGGCGRRRRPAGCTSPASCVDNPGLGLEGAASAGIESGQRARRRLARRRPARGPGAATGSGRAALPRRPGRTGGAPSPARLPARISLAAAPGTPLLAATADGRSVRLTPASAGRCSARAGTRRTRADARPPGGRRRRPPGWGRARARRAALAMGTTEVARPRPPPCLDEGSARGRRRPGCRGTAPGAPEPGAAVVRGLPRGPRPAQPRGPSPDRPGCLPSGQPARTTEAAPRRGRAQGGRPADLGRPGGGPRSVAGGASCASCAPAACSSPVPSRPRRAGPRPDHGRLARRRLPDCGGRLPRLTRSGCSTTPAGSATRPG